MNRMLYQPRDYISKYDGRCLCQGNVRKRKFSIIQKRKKNRGEEKSFQYPDLESNETRSKTFQIRYHKQFSSTTKFLLNNFKNKYLYYAIDDILYSLKSNPVERNNLLVLLYSPIVFLQNNLFIDFFDIWIQEVSIDEISKSNRFLSKDTKIFQASNSIRIQFLYKLRVPAKKPETLW
jgi:hypothetical protein